MLFVCSQTQDPECLFSFHSGGIEGLAVSPLTYLMATTALDCKHELPPILCVCYTCMHVHVCVYMFWCVFVVHACLCTCVLMYVCMCVLCMHPCSCTCVLVCTYVAAKE